MVIKGPHDLPMRGMPDTKFLESAVCPFGQRSDNDCTLQEQNLRTLSALWR